jgi:hypothetical protein
MGFVRAKGGLVKKYPLWQFAIKSLSVNTPCQDRAGLESSLLATIEHNHRRICASLMILGQEADKNGRKLDAITKDLF